MNLLADTLCQAFMTISARTWNSMRKNFITPIQKREDAFTADNLQDLYLINSKKFTVFDFTPHVESNLSGADWEMWFIDDNDDSFGFAVQAKKLSSSYTYDIGYIPKNKIPQIDRLFDYCNKYNNLTPLYCFYNYFTNINSTIVWPCKSFPESETLWGCSISHGLNIKILNSLSKNSINDILPISFPLHCILCCPGIGRKRTGTLSDRAAGFADTLKELLDIKDATQKLENIKFDNPEIKKLPKRIAALRELKEPNLTKDLIDTYWKDFKPKMVLIIEDKKASS